MRTVIALVALVAVGAAFSLGTSAPSPEPAAERVVAAAVSTLGERCLTGIGEPTGLFETAGAIEVEGGLGLEADCIERSLPAGTTATITSTETAARLCAPMPDAGEGCWNGSRLVVPVDAWLAGDTEFSDRLSELAPQD